MKVRFFLILCVCALAFLGCSKDDEPRTSSVAGMWTMESDPTQYIYCYTDGGFVMNLSEPWIMDRIMCGTFTLSGDIYLYEVNE